MADATPIASDGVVEQPQEPQAAAPAPTTSKKAKSPAKTLADGFVIPEGAIQLDSHEAYRVDN